MKENKIILVSLLLLIILIISIYINNMYEGFTTTPTAIYNGVAYYQQQFDLAKQKYPNLALTIQNINTVYTFKKSDGTLLTTYQMNNYHTPVQYINDASYWNIQSIMLDLSVGGYDKSFSKENANELINIITDSSLPDLILISPTPTPETSRTTPPGTTPGTTPFATSRTTPPGTTPGTTPFATTPTTTHTSKTYTKESVLSYLNEVDVSMSDYLKYMFDEPPKCPQVTTTTPAPTCPPLPTCRPPELIKCVADFGTNIGDKLSGGQGVLQNTRHVCPNTLKKCSNFKCGSAFGTCISE
jgi:hypothetical protein